MIDFKNHTSKIVLFSAICLLFGLLVSCGSDGSVSEATSGDRGLSELAGTSWSLSLLNGDGLLLLSLITADFDENGTVSGLAGCNGYSASYQVDGDQITISTPTTTSLSCRNLLMNQESAYLDTLVSIVSYQIKGTTLEMRDVEGRAMLVYDTLLQTSLPGTSWRLLEYSDGSGSVVPVMPETTVTADYGDDGIVSGSAGCNGYSASYQVAAKLLEIGPATMTEIYCSQPEGIMDQEVQYLRALEDSSAYVIVRETMGLLSEDESILAIYESSRP
jgi:heat shock protein HslJ